VLPPGTTKEGKGEKKKRQRSGSDLSKGKEKNGEASHSTHSASMRSAKGTASKEKRERKSPIFYVLGEGKRREMFKAQMERRGKGEKRALIRNRPSVTVHSNRFRRERKKRE